MVLCRSRFVAARAPGRPVAGWDPLCVGRSRLGTRAYTRSGSRRGWEGRALSRCLAKGGNGDRAVPLSKGEALEIAQHPLIAQRLNGAEHRHAKHQTWNCLVLGNEFWFFVPRPLRLTLLGFGAFSCLTGTFVAFSNVATDTSLIIGEGPLNNLVINLFGFVIFSTLFWLDRSGAERRVSKRKQIREAQIEFGDREVYVNKEGEKMSKLKEVDDDWILRRLERWGRRDRMPFVGPEKGAILQSLVKEKRPKLVVEVGTLCGYSAILIAQVLPPGSRLWTYEVDWKWVLVAKRFLWQASQGSKNAALAETISDKVDVRWGDARKKMAELEEDRIDMLFLDGIPNQYIEYLKAAEDRLAHGALVVADNAGVFADGGLKEYLQYVRNSPKYESSFVESVYEWSNVPDGLEVSEFIG